MTGKKIMVLEDEAAIREMVLFALKKERYDVLQAGSVNEALDIVTLELPDLVLVDWMLPGVSGIEFVRQMKKDSKTRGIPIIMLTARAQEEDKVTGLDTGADDYIGKPFSPRELMARIRALLRRASTQNAEQLLEAQGLKMDLNSHRVLFKGEEIALGPTEYKLLQFLMSNQNRVYSRAQLLDHVWGHDVYVEERTVDVHILRLRKALAPYQSDQWVQTVRGAGYRFSC